MAKIRLLNLAHSKFEPRAIGPLLFALLLCAIAGCTPLPLDTSDLLITMSRNGNCFNCPWYTVTLFADGHVLFNGIASTEAHGERFAIIPQDSLDAIAHDFLRMRFFNRPERYDTRQFYNGATTTIDVRFAGMHHIVRDHYGAPDSLHFLERRLDDMTGASFWIGAGAEAPNPNSKEARTRRREIDSLEAIDDEMLQEYQSLRDAGETRKAQHLFFEERKLSDSIAKAYQYFRAIR